MRDAAAAAAAGVLLRVAAACVWSVLFRSYGKGVNRRRQGALSSECVARAVRCAMYVLSGHMSQTLRRVFLLTDLQQN